MFSQTKLGKLLDYAERERIQTEDLDDLVHDAASRVASATNNLGLQMQLNYLLVELGEDATRTALEEIVAEAKKTPRREG